MGQCNKYNVLWVGLPTVCSVTISISKGKGVQSGTKTKCFRERWDKYETKCGNFEKCETKLKRIENVNLFWTRPIR